MAFTLGARDFKGVQCVCVTFTQPRFGDYREEDISVTLRANGADYGGGSEVIVMSEVMCMATGQANAEIMEGGGVRH